MEDQHGHSQQYGHEPSNMSPDDTIAFRKWQESQRVRRAAQKAARHEARDKRRVENLTIVAVENVPKHVSKLFRTEAKALLSRLIAAHPKPEPKTRE